MNKFEFGSKIELYSEKTWVEIYVLIVYNLANLT